MNGDNIHRKLAVALNYIQANVGAFSPKELEEMVREKIIDARVVPVELRTDFVKRKLGLTK